MTTRKQQRSKNVDTGSHPLRVAFYLRVSSDEQMERGTIEAQRLYLHERYRGELHPDAPPDVRWTLVGEFVDDGWSGAIPLRDRPDGKRMLEAAADGQIDAVIFYRLDRLGRTARVLLDAHDELETHGTAVTSASEPFDTRPGPHQAIGRFLFQLLASMAELERSTIKERTMGGKHRTAVRGEHVNGAVPFGFEINTYHHLIPSNRIVAELGMTESQLVLEIYERLADGQTCYSVAKWLQEAGVPSTRRMWNKKKSHSVETSNVARGWTNRRVWEMIHNPIYKGVRLLNFEERSYEQRVTPIVSEALWEAANERIKRNNAWSSKRTDDYVYLLSKKLQCRAPLPNETKCDMFYTGGLSGGVRYYSCNGNDRGNEYRRGARCGARGIRASRIEKAIWDDVVWQVKHPEETLAEIKRTLHERRSETSAAYARREALQQHRENLLKARQYLREQISNARRPVAEVEDDLQANGQAIVDIEGKLAEVAITLEVDSALERRLSRTVPFMQRIAAEINDIEARQDRHEMRRIIDELVGGIIVLNGTQPGEPQFQVHYRFRSIANTSNVRKSGVVDNRSTQSQDTTSVGEFVNVMTVVVASEIPGARKREIA